MFDLSFYKNKKVLVTGHTGFKGTWLCMMLSLLGADVTGYALEPNTEPSLFELSQVRGGIRHIIGDIRDLELLKSTFDEVQPEIVIHMAAQPLVRESYINPVYTYDTNVMGTVNILECVRLNNCVKSFLNVTTDKVYYNDERNIGFTEDQPLDGFDPYSNSKSCSELVTHSYKSAFFSDNHCAISTARAGNVIGGGDFSKDRIIPDCVRAVINKEDIIVRNPYSIRPYQFVLEPLYAYLMIAAKQYEDNKFQGYYNVGPDDKDCIDTGELVTKFCDAWGDGASWKSVSDDGPHEANFLKLDSTRIKKTFDWKPRYSVNDAIRKTVEWYKSWNNVENIYNVMELQVKEFLGEQ